MKKQQLLDKLEQAWLDFNESFAGLSDEQLVEPGVSGDWSVKDILAHVSSWEAEALKYLPVILQGERPPRYSRMYGGIDAFNAQMTAAWRELPLAEARRRLAETHQRLMTYLHDVPEGQFASETRFRRRMGWYTYKHYPQHSQAIRAWRELSGLSRP